MTMLQQFYVKIVHGYLSSVLHTHMYHKQKQINETQMAHMDMTEAHFVLPTLHIQEAHASRCTPVSCNVEIIRRLLVNGTC